VAGDTGIDNMSYVNDTGLPSVTQILSPYINKDWFTQEHSDRGTAVHECCHIYLKGEWLIPELPIYWRGYFDSFKRWADQVIDSILLLETRLKSDDLGYCGQPDFVGTLKGSDKIVLLDWKTSQQYYPWFSLQGAAYRKLSSVDAGIETEGSASVRLKADGSGCLVDYPEKDQLNIFYGLLNAHYFFNPKRR